MLTALDAMPEKMLIANELEADGRYCALGVVGKSRGIPMADLDPEDSDEIAGAFDIAAALAREIVFMNDDYYDESPEHRWSRMRKWVAEQKLAEGKSDEYTKGGQP